MQSKETKERALARKKLRRYPKKLQRLLAESEQRSLTLRMHRNAVMSKHELSIKFIENHIKNLDERVYEVRNRQELLNQNRLKKPGSINPMPKVERVRVQPKRKLVRVTRRGKFQFKPLLLTEWKMDTDTNTESQYGTGVIAFSESLLGIHPEWQGKQGD